MQYFTLNKVSPELGDYRQFFQYCLSQDSGQPMEDIRFHVSTTRTANT